ncbi:amidase [Streptomyces bohaiensis]|uniref:Amidase n=1 Tax=Streptomyces bohaiensis TaxID=1431344 RepID=A0ABX1CF36_9ACTN|nr:amidase [Streptomyces bohaiensis]NJQ17655.1 amidase [Streptomyces bohaiensis]
MTDLTALSAERLVAGYRAGELSPVEVARATLDRAAAAQHAVNAFVLLLEEEALEQARASERRWHRREPAGPLDGVPVTVKDILLLRGHPTLRGSAAAATAPNEEDAPAVARLRESGAVFLGKTTTPEYGWKGVTDCPPHGATGNPRAPERTAGGSSGGGAAAVALGAGPLSLGTDGGGSVRIPAAFCGVFALKPTYGRVPLHPASAFGTLAHVGPMTRDARDAALLLDVIGHPDPRDWSHLGEPPAAFSDGLTDDSGSGAPLRGVRIAYSPTLGPLPPGAPPVDPEIAAAVRRGAERLAELGAEVEEVDPSLPDPLVVREAFHTLWFSGAARATAGITGASRELMDPGLREVCATGERYSAVEYLAAVDVRMAMGRLMGAFHERHDLLLTPTLPLTAFGLGREVPEGSGMRRWTEWTPFTYPFNMTQQPAASVPCGLHSDGLPMGLQLVGPRHADAVVLRVAHALYAAGGTALPPPE